MAVGVVSVDDAPTLVRFSGEQERDLIQLGEFTIESEGFLSVRDVYNREYEAIGVEPGNVVVAVWGNDDREPSEVALSVR